MAVKHVLCIIPAEILPRVFSLPANADLTFRQGPEKFQRNDTGTVDNLEDEPTFPKYKTAVRHKILEGVLKSYQS